METMKTPAPVDWSTIGRTEVQLRNTRQPMISELFGRQTFTKKVMAERLSKSVYERLVNTIENNEPLDGEIADEVAHAMKEWAISLGATHFCHWFQPQRGMTAEKHDSFLSFNEKGEPIERFSGKQLSQGEPDASSFPSGGSRSTFEARGYTAWDPTSPAFVLKTGRSCTLVVPSVYLSYTGEVLDRKTPLLRSLHALEERAYKMLKLFGNRSARYVRATIGAEQEYFLIAKEFYNKRPDLVYTGRTLLGVASAKHQQMEDHYFGEIKPRVLNFMADLDSALWERGIPAKTRHNEVAPNQFEIAPIFEEANLAVDHNLQEMEIMRKTADEHGLMILLHEKPFAGINGSGKHLNWSLADSDGNNLLEPGQAPKKNVQFLVFLSAILQGVHKFGGLLRTAVADAGNDHRLGANEAPPAIMSVYLGEFLDKLLGEIEKGKEGSETLAKAIDLGLKRLPVVAKDNSDRNRTSPIAFTGNKFEFRAVGASQSTSEPAMVLNLLTAWGLDVMAAKIEKHLGKKTDDVTASALAAIKETVAETKRVRFEGNGYSAEWHTQAAKRGLPAAKDTPAALMTLIEKDVVGLFEKYEVLTQDEIHALYDIKLEAYCKTKEIELKLVKELAATYVAPAVVKHVNEVGQAAGHLASAKGRGKLLRTKLDESEAILEGIETGIGAVEAALADAEHTADLVKKARLIADQGVDALTALRAACDKAEETVDDELWPLPKYREMLFFI